MACDRLAKDLEVNAIKYLNPYAQRALGFKVTTGMALQGEARVTSIRGYNIGRLRPPIFFVKDRAP
jgi:hypothetical protein